jgi:DUF1680 family protein
VLRTIAGAGTMAYGVTAKGVVVNLYGANRLETKLADGARVVFEQETDYPWEGEVLIRVAEAPGSEFSLSLRIPAWAKGASVRVNGKTVHAEGCGAEPAPVSYFEIRRAWRAGDAVTLSLPLRPRMLLAHPLVEESRNQAAVMRGPLVYCLESADLPEGVGIGEMLLPSDARFAEEKGSGPLAGMTVLACEGARLAAASGAPPDGQALYRELGDASLERMPLRFVPYFAWDNRGEGEMTVWLPLKWA